MSLTHAFQSAFSDGSDATRLQPSHWNADHVFGGGVTGNLLQRDSGQSDGMSWTAAPTLTSLTLNGGDLNVGVSPNLTFLVAPAGGDFTTLAAAFTFIEGLKLSSRATIIVTVADGTYTSATPLNIAQQHAWVYVRGQNSYTKNVSSIQSSSGGAGAWTLVLNVDSVANVAIGDYVTITSPAGGSNPTYLAGCWPVTNVDAVNTRITITSTHKNATAPSGAVTATMTVLKTILKFTGADGIEVWTKSVVNLDKIAIVGDGSAHIGLSVEDVSRCFVETVVGINGWGSDGVVVLYNSQLNGQTLAASTCANGITCSDAGSINLAYGVASGNTFAGFNTVQRGTIRLFGGVASGNGNNGCLANNGGAIIPTSVFATGNVSAGSSTDGPASLIDRSSLTATNNGGGTDAVINNNGLTIGLLGRLKSLTNLQSSPFDSLVIESLGSTGSWEGAVDLKVSFNGGSSLLGLRVLAPSAGVTDVQFGRALVSLGGGSAPTFGTIGGSGPATAAQNSWMRFLDSTGAACWVPVWK